MCNCCLLTVHSKVTCLYLLVRLTVASRCTVGVCNCCLLTFHSKVTCLYLLVKLRSIRRIPSGESLLTRRVLRERLSHILKENSFQFNGKDHSFLQSHGAAMGTKVLVAFTNIFMAKMEHEIMRQSNTTLNFCKDLFMTSYRCGAQTETKLKNFCLKLSSYNQIYDWNIRNRDVFRKHYCLQGWKIP